jgi:hypothetical protein
MHICDTIYHLIDDQTIRIRNQDRIRIGIVAAVQRSDKLSAWHSLLSSKANNNN